MLDVRLKCKYQYLRGQLTLDERDILNYLLYVILEGLISIYIVIHNLGLGQMTNNTPFPNPFFSAIILISPPLLSGMAWLTGEVFVSPAKCFAVMFLFFFFFFSFHVNT